MMTELEDRIGNDKQDIQNTKDENEKTWINESLWKKVAFKIIGYFVYVVGTSMITVPFIGWDMSAFLTGLKIIILPIVWSALDAQSRNREIQERLENEERLEVEKKTWSLEEKALKDEIATLTRSVNEKQLEVFRIKAELDAACKTAAANEEALKNV